MNARLHAMNGIQQACVRWTKRKKAHTNSDSNSNSNNSNNTNETWKKKQQPWNSIGNSDWAIARAHFLLVRVSMYCVSIVGVVVRVLCNRRAHTFNSSDSGNSSNSTQQHDGAYEVLVGFASFRIFRFKCMRFTGNAATPTGWNMYAIVCDVFVVSVVYSFTRSLTHSLLHCSVHIQAYIHRHTHLKWKWKKKKTRAGWIKKWSSAFHINHPDTTTQFAISNESRNQNQVGCETIRLSPLAFTYTILLFFFLVVQFYVSLTLSSVCAVV